MKVRGHNMGRVPNPNIHLAPPAGTPDPQFNGNVKITVTDAGSGNWNGALILTGPSAVPLAPPATATITFRNVATGIIIAQATYTVGAVIGTDTPINQTNWSAVLPHLSGTVSDGQTLVLNLHTFLLANPLVFWPHTVNSIQWELYAQNNSSPSATDIGIISYSYAKVEYSTSRSGTHTITWRLTAMDTVLVDWANGTTQVATVNTTNTALTTTYPNSSAKSVRIAVPSARKITFWTMFTQAINSVEWFDASACGTIRWATGNLTGIPNLNLGACAYLDLRANAITSLGNVTIGTACTQITLGQNNLTSLPSGWNTSNVHTLEVNQNPLGSLPGGWSTGSLATLWAYSCQLTSLPSGWNCSSLSVIRVYNNPLMGNFPSNWIVAAPLELLAYTCGLTTIPNFDYQNCLNLRLNNNSISNVPITHNFAALLTLYLQNNPITTWSQALFGLQFTQLKMFTCLLNAGNLDAVLSQLRTSYDASPRFIDADISANAQSPSSAGVSDANYLISNGCLIAI